jgi:hypothetical protein
MTPTTSILVVALVPLVIWRMYSRIRRMIGRQRSRLWRHWTAAIVFPLVILLLGMVAALHPVSLATLAAGVAVGAGLAIWGLRLTRFEATPEGFFYTPSAHIGIALSLLLVARILYRLVEIYGFAASGTAGAPPDFARSPLTLLIVGTLAAYYAAYAIGILRWRRSLRNEAAAAP